MRPQDQGAHHRQGVGHQVPQGVHVHVAALQGVQARQSLGRGRLLGAAPLTQRVPPARRTPAYPPAPPPRTAIPLGPPTPFLSGLISPIAPALPPRARESGSTRTEPACGPLSCDGVLAIPTRRRRRRILRRERPRPSAPDSKTPAPAYARMRVHGGVSAPPIAGLLTGCHRARARTRKKKTEYRRVGPTVCPRAVRQMSVDIAADEPIHWSLLPEHYATHSVAPCLRTDGPAPTVPRGPRASHARATVCAPAAPSSAAAHATKSTMRSGASALHAVAAAHAATASDRRARELRAEASRCRGRRRRRDAPPCPKPVRTKRARVACPWPRPPSPPRVPASSSSSVRSPLVARCRAVAVPRAVGCRCGRAWRPQQPPTLTRSMSRGAGSRGAATAAPYSP